MRSPSKSEAEAARAAAITAAGQVAREQRHRDCVGKMKQFASWFTHGVPGGGALRKQIFEAKNGDAVLDAIEASSLLARLPPRRMTSSQTSTKRCSFQQPPTATDRGQTLPCKTWVEGEVASVLRFRQTAFTFARQRSSSATRVHSTRGERYRSTTSVAGWMRSAGATR